MPDDRYRFNVGDFECLAILDTISIDKFSTVFSNVDATLYEAQLRARGENTDQARYYVHSLAVFSDDWVLIDTGYGTLGNEAGQLLPILSDEDIRPEHIILSHAHPDHYGGLLNENGEENFPNVPVYMCQNEWIEFTAGTESQKNPQLAQLTRNYLMPAEHQIERIECLNMSEILPGFSVIKLPGHTAHHIGILIESGDDKLLYVADALVHPLHLENLDWQFWNDADHEIARESRVKLAEFAIEYDALVMTTHFPFPGLGRIVRDGEGYRWVAVEV